MEDLQARIANIKQKLNPESLKAQIKQIELESGQPHGRESPHRQRCDVRGDRRDGGADGRAGAAALACRFWPVRVSLGGRLFQAWCGSPWIGAELCDMGA